ncbi:unnamed protein product [Bathycoccus prasinos]
MPSTFSLSRSAFFHTALSLKKDRGGGGKGETRRKRENLSKSNETVVVVARTNFDERKSRRREALVSFPSLTSAFVVFFSLLLNDADAFVEEWSEEDEITSCAYFDIGLCESIVRAERALGGDAVCSLQDADKIGRVKIGLYGKKCPDTEKMFRKLVESGAYDRTVFHDIRKGEFIAFGANGSKRLGQVSVPEGTFSAGERNADLTKASAFRGNHLKPGTVSLALSYDGSRTASPFDGNVYSEVIITTGPAPVPSLDGKNIIFGRVDRESLDVISKIASTPVFSPSSQVKAWNFVASRVGDERAATSKLVWTKPTKAVAIFQSGILEV